MNADKHGYAKEKGIQFYVLVLSVFIRVHPWPFRLSPHCALQDYPVHMPDLMAGETISRG
jgi:hypothetical protein